MAHVIGYPVMYGPMDGASEDDMRERYVARVEQGAPIVIEATGHNIAKQLDEIVPAPVLRAWATYHVLPAIMDALYLSADEKNKLATDIQDALRKIDDR